MSVETIIEEDHETVTDLERYCLSQLPPDFQGVVTKEKVCPCSLLVKYRDFGYVAAMRYVWSLRK